MIPLKKTTGFVCLSTASGLAESPRNGRIWICGSRKIAPSNSLRKWFAHDPKRWSAFAAKYRTELTRNKDLVRQLKALEAENSNITLLYSAHDQLHNQAVALRRFLQSARGR